MLEKAGFVVGVLHLKTAFLWSVVKMGFLGGEMTDIRMNVYDNQDVVGDYLVGIYVNNVE